MLTHMSCPSTARGLRAEGVWRLVGEPVSMTCIGLAFGTRSPTTSQLLVKGLALAEGPSTGRLPGCMETLSVFLSIYGHGREPEELPDEPSDAGVEADSQAGSLPLVTIREMCDVSTSALQISSMSSSWCLGCTCLRRSMHDRRDQDFRNQFLGDCEPEVHDPRTGSKGKVSPRTRRLVVPHDSDPARGGTQDAPRDLFRGGLGGLRGFLHWNEGTTCPSFLPREGQSSEIWT